jgi:hypothetical protein
VDSVSLYDYALEAKVHVKRDELERGILYACTKFLKVNIKASFLSSYWRNNKLYGKQNAARPLAVDCFDS